MLAAPRHIGCSRVNSPSRVGALRSSESSRRRGDPSRCHRESARRYRLLTTSRHEETRHPRQSPAAPVRHRHVHDASRPMRWRPQLPDVDCFVLAMNDAGRRHAYPARVRFEIAEGDLGSYRRAADFLNVNQVDVLSVQHEYGIFGGKAGAHLLALLRELRMPIVTTLHTILSAPNPSQRAVLDELARLSERLVVMSAVGRRAAQAGARHSRRPDRPDPARHPARAGRAAKQGPARRGRQDRHPDLRAAVAGQGHRVRHRRAAGDSRRPSRRPSTSSSARRIRTSSSAKARRIG